MTDYNAITEAETNPRAPGTSSLWKRWWKNPIAMFEGAPGAPNLMFAALGTLVAGSTVRSRIDAVQNSPGGGSLEVAVFGMGQPGVIRLSAEHGHGGGATSSVTMIVRRWRLGVFTTLVTYTAANGSGYVARTLDVSVLPGDTISVTLQGSGGSAISTVRNIRLSTNGGLWWPFPPLNALE